MSSEFEDREYDIESTEPFPRADQPTETMGGGVSAASVMLRSGDVVAAGGGVGREVWPCARGTRLPSARGHAIVSCDGFLNAGCY